MGKIKKAVCLFGIIVLLFHLAACGMTEPEVNDAVDEGEQQITLSYWSWLPTTEQSEIMISAFEKQNPGIEIEYTHIEQGDFFEKLQMAMASGNGPDIFGMSTGAKTEYYGRFSDDMKAVADEFWPGWEKIIDSKAVSQCMTTDGKQVGMPLLIVGMTNFLYNKSLMEECGIESVPATYEELKIAAQKANKQGYVCVAAGAEDGWVNTDWFVQISNEFEKGAVYQAERGERKWTDQCFIDTMQAWQNMFFEGIFEDGALGVATYPDARDQYFYSRKAVFLLTGSWQLGATSASWKELEGTEVGENGDVLGMCMFPAMSGNGEVYGTSGVDIMICVNKECEEKEAAMKFVQFMSNGDGQQYWVNKLQGTTVSNEIVFTGVIDGKLQRTSMEEINKYVVNAVGNRKFIDSEVEHYIMIAMQNVAAGAEPLKELEKVQSKLQNH